MTTPSSRVLFVDALHLRHKSYDGQFTYLTNLIAAICKSDVGLRLYIFCSSKSLQDLYHLLPYTNCSFIIFPFSNLFLRIIYQQVLIPLFLIFAKILFFRSSICLFSPAYITSLLCPWYVKIVLTIHDMYHVLFPAHIGLLRSLYWRLFIPLSCARAASIISVSANTARDIKRYYAFASSKVIVSLESGEHSRFELCTALSDAHIPSSPPVTVEYLLSIGSTKSIKDPYTLLNGFVKFLQSVQNLQLLITGPVSSGYARELKSYGESASTNIRFLGSIPKTQLSILLNSASAVVVSSFYEGFCLPALEAQALGKIVICPRIPVLLELLGDSAIFYDSGSPESLASALVLFSKLSASEKSGLKHRALSNSQRYKWSDSAVTLISLF